MKRGIVLLAVGKPAYVYWAYNMAFSIKHFNPALKIQLIHEKGLVANLPEGYSKVFDIRTIIDHKDCHESMRLSPARAKLSMYKYMAFKENIYLDVDAICIQDIEPLFNQLKGRDYSVENQAFGTKDMTDFKEMLWGKPSDIWNHFSLSDNAKLPAVNSSFQYIRKSRKAAALFKAALKLYETNPFPTKLQIMKWGKDNQPDELYLNVALSKIDNKDMFFKSPIYFPLRIATFPGEGKLIANGKYVLGYFGEKAILNISGMAYYDKLMMVMHKKKGINCIYKINPLLVHKFIKTN